MMITEFDSGIFRKPIAAFICIGVEVGTCSERMLSFGFAGRSCIPILLVEIGQNGSRKEEHVETVANSVENASGILGIWNKPRKNVPPPLRLFESRTAVRTPYSGLFYPFDLDRRYVFEGDVIGTIRGDVSKEVQLLYSPIDGYALYGEHGPSMRAGDPVMTIGIPTDGFN